MANNESKNRYYATKDLGDGFVDLTTMFDGIAILKVDGYLERGKPVNIYTAQWVNNQGEDFLITTLDGNGNPVVVRENVDISITFIIKQKYATTSGINVETVHDSFIDYMTSSDLYVKSSYVANKYVHCVCLQTYKPTTVKLGRGDDSYIMGTITLHCLDAAQIDEETPSTPQVVEETPSETEE